MNSEQGIPNVAGNKKAFVVKRRLKAVGEGIEPSRGS
jgi:hypothetical protein